jgi:hypothetical protein
MRKIYKKTNLYIRVCNNRKKEAKLYMDSSKEGYNKRKKAIDSILRVKLTKNTVKIL